MKKFFLFILATFMTMTVAGAVTVVTFSSEDVYAADCSGSFLGLKPWHDGLTTTATDAAGNATCVIQAPAKGDSDAMASFVWRIVLNISADISLLVGYAAIIFVIWGGYKYIMSTGEPQKVAQAKQMIMNALIGLVIAVLATVIVNTIISVLGGAAS